MSARVSVTSLGPSALAQVRAKLAAEPRTAKANKYHAQRCSYKSKQGFGRVYDSKAEATHAMYLDEGIGKNIRYWLPQIPFPLPGGVTYRADFMVVFRDGLVIFRDVKGLMTQASKNKIKQVRALYGVEIEIVRR